MRPTEVTPGRDRMSALPAIGVDELDRVIGGCANCQCAGGSSGSNSNMMMMLLPLLAQQGGTRRR